MPITLLDEHLRIKGRTTCYETPEEMQRDLDANIVTYAAKRPRRVNSVLVQASPAIKVRVSSLLASQNRDSFLFQFSQQFLVSLLCKLHPMYHQKGSTPLSFRSHFPRIRPIVRWSSKSTFCCCPLSFRRAKARPSSFVRPRPTISTV